MDLSDDVRAWHVGLTPTGKAAADRVMERLASDGHLLRMPHSRPLGLVGTSCASRAST